jgi:hypothetical protein
VAGEAGEVRGLPQPAVQPRRGHFQAVVGDALDLEDVLQLAAGRFAVGHRDPALAERGIYFM